MIWRTVLKGHSTRKLENHCFRLTNNLLGSSCLHLSGYFLCGYWGSELRFSRLDSHLSHLPHHGDISSFYILEEVLWHLGSRSWEGAWMKLLTVHRRCSYVTYQRPTWPKMSLVLCVEKPCLKEIRYPHTWTSGIHKLITEIFFLIEVISSRKVVFSLTNKGDEKL